MKTRLINSTFLVLILSACPVSGEQVTQGMQSIQTAGIVPQMERAPNPVARVEMQKARNDGPTEFVDTDANIVNASTENPTITVKANCPIDGSTPVAKDAVALAAVSVESVAKMNLNECKFFSNFSKSIPDSAQDALKQALMYRKLNRDKFKKNPRFISFTDYSINSSKERFFQLDLYTGQVVAQKISHGRTSDSGKHRGDMTQCKSGSGSRTNATRPGFFKTAETYSSNGSCKKKKANGKPTTYAIKMANPKLTKPKYGHCSHGEFRNQDGSLNWGWPLLGKGFPKSHNAMRMDGLNPSVNGKARSKGVVMHGAWYNQNSVMGRSYGCPAFHPDIFSKVTKNIHNGSLFYAYTPQCPNDMKKILKTVPNWQNVCK